MDIYEMRMSLGETQSEFAARYNIPFRSIQNWEAGIRKPPQYVLELLESRVKEDIVNRKTILLPKYDPHKKNLPKRTDYIGALAWLRAVSEHIGAEVVFALDEALMCQGLFGGRNDEYVIWVYGDDALKKFNGIVVLGNRISTHYVKERNGLKYTEFNRTLFDAFSNEDILDMQGITESLSNYYYSHNETFEGIFIEPRYEKRFEELASDAIDYYNS